jgi:hypothetical protein
VTTLSPMMIRSPGLSSTLSAMTVSVPTRWGDAPQRWLTKGKCSVEAND